MQELLEKSRADDRNWAEFGKLQWDTDTDSFYKAWYRSPASCLYLLYQDYFYNHFIITLNPSNP
eukprot:1136792-Pelagomonas_calceolata.AAC.2